MTYYEWITLIENTKTGPISEDLLNKINNSNIEYQGDIKVRFLNHIVDLINARLNNSLDNFLLKYKTIVQDKNNLVMEINQLKQEIIYARKLTQIKYFDETTKKNLIEGVRAFGEEMNTSIKNGLINTNDNEIRMLINNLDFNN